MELTSRKLWKAGNSGYQHKSEISKCARDEFDQSDFVFGVRPNLKRKAESLILVAM